MMVIRPVQSKDLDKLTAFAFATEVDLPSLPKDKNLLKEKIDHSQNTFAHSSTAKIGGLYLFVLEDLNNQTIEGTSGIQVTPPGKVLTYFYQKKSVHHFSEKLGIDKKMDILEVVPHREHPSEICALYLNRAVRHSGHGKLLSFSRFLFIAAFPDRVDPILMARLRGVIDDQGVCPFWETVGRPFLDHHSMHDVEILYTQDKGIIAHLLPKYPIYYCLLPEKIIQILGKTHHSSAAALKMLEDEGFKFKDEIDVFDGGPKITVERDKIRTVKNSKVVKITAITKEPVTSESFLISNERIDFRACIGMMEHHSNELKLPLDVANALNVKAGDTIRYISVD
jgi:arginine N-succinyltransferase